MFSLNGYAGTNANVLGTEKIQTFSYINTNGEKINGVVKVSNNQAVSEIYVNGILSQKATADGNKKTIVTELYDSSKIDFFSKSINSSDRVGSINGFKTYVTHKPVSSRKIDDKYFFDEYELYSYNDNLTNEPVDNTGLRTSFGGYYYLGHQRGPYYARNLFGYLHRKYTTTYEGETKYWSWGANETLGAISAYISLFGGPVSAIIGILIFTVGNVLAYAQAVKLETITFDYDYKVLVNGKDIFYTNRNITYWKIKNDTKNKVTWEQKSFNYGFSMSNYEMVKAGIDKYLEENN